MGQTGSWRASMGTHDLASGLTQDNGHVILLVVVDGSIREILSDLPMTSPAPGERGSGNASSRCHVSAARSSPPGPDSTTRTRTKLGNSGTRRSPASQ